MRLEHLDPRFLSKSARERLGVQWPTQGTPTTMSTSVETFDTECASTDASGLSSEEKAGTAGSPWWEMDLSRWPGPSEEPDLRAVWIAYSSQITLAARAWGKTFTAAAEVFQNLGAVLADPVEQDRPKHMPPRYAPPRWERTYDRMGRRLR